VAETTIGEATPAERAKAKGWPDGLIERAFAVKTPRSQLDYWLDAEPTETFLFQITRIVEVSERLQAGRYRGRELTFRDEESFSDLWANAPERVGDDWEVTVDRSPNALAQFRLQPGASISVIEEAGDIVACTVWSPANCLIGGEPVSIHYAQGLRVRSDRRREGLGDLVRRAPVRALQKPTVGQVMYLRIGNAGMAGFLEAVKFQADSDRPQQIVGVTYLEARPAPPTADVRPIADGDIEACAALINRTHEGLDLFCPYGPESLRAVLDEGIWGEGPSTRRSVYGWRDAFVLEEGGRIVACAGLWDRGRDMREIWRGKDGEERRIEVAAALDVGCAAGHDPALGRILRHLGGLAAERGRQSLIADLEHLPAVTAALADLEPRVESRTLEWSPYAPELPRQLGECFIDLRYW
jgi:hypothetical protein